MKTIIAIGGGDLKERQTLKIDEYVAALAKERAGENRACALFIPTASHDYMPYYNTFHKVYTGVFNIKTDVALTVFKETDYEKLKGKFLKADVIYVGGGDTVFMLEHWQNSGMLPLILDAYERGVIIAGLSAGAICWFERMFTDTSKTLNGEVYSLYNALGVIKGVATPHYNSRGAAFDNEVVEKNMQKAFAMEDLSAIVIKNGEIAGSLSSGGTAWALKYEDGKLVKTAIAPVI
ncbi:MAG: Type 1 glutamine amidotransferase-like domain-containing protein [Clostridia bacterium]|nr:Type 1 glutamine amidotransferase-like domain-containing protein [Clostridia bacterium]